MDFKKYHNDIEIGSEKFNEIMLKRNNNGKIVLNSERFHNDFKTLVTNLKKDKTPTYEFILNKLPLDSLTEISTSNENKVNLYFQRELARDMQLYLNLTNMTITQKQYFLGFSFMLSQFIYNNEEFINRQKVKDMYYKFTQSDYDEYLRTEGYNICKSL